jgi:hypothetical protein
MGCDTLKRENSVRLRNKRKGEKEAQGGGRKKEKGKVVPVINFLLVTHVTIIT